MRTFLISAAAAASALAVATPAAAQYYPAPPPPPQGYAWGYQNNYGHIRSLQVRIDNLQRRIARLDSRDRISEREARRLREESRDIERRLRRAAYNGLSPREHALITARIQRLEARIFRDVRDGRGWANDGWIDRDRDGRDDRWERRRDRDDD